MNFLVLLLFLALSTAQNVNPTCARDNCLRAVIASNVQPGPASASQDCASFFRATVTPATQTSTSVIFTTVTAPAVTIRSSLSTITTVVATISTITTGVGFTTIGGGSPGPFKRSGDFLDPRQQTIIPSTTPTYASACSNSARYASACSCIGITSSTLTVAAPQATTISTSTIHETPTIIFLVTSTTTSIIPATATCDASLFYLQAVGSSVNGQYITLSSSADSSVTSFTSNTASAAQFRIRASRLCFNDYFAKVDPVGLSKIYFDVPGTFSTRYDLICNLARPNAMLECTGGQEQELFNLCPADCNTGIACAGLTLGTEYNLRCEEIALKASPVCFGK